MTVGQELVKELIDAKKQVAEIMEKMDEAETSLMGMELTYKGKYACIEYVDGNSQNASLYVEDEDGESESVYIPLQELAELLA